MTHLSGPNQNFQTALVMDIQIGLLSVHILSSTLCYRLLRTVHCIYSRLSHYRPTRTDYCTSLRQCHSALLSQLLLSLKLLSQLHSCRSSIVRVKRYSYCFVPPLPNNDTRHASPFNRSAFFAIALLYSIPPVSTFCRQSDSRASQRVW